MRRDTGNFLMVFLLLSGSMVLLGGCTTSPKKDLDACASMIADGFRPVAKEPTERFLGKVQEDTAQCRGGDKATAYRGSPWVDWQNYWAAGDASSLFPGTTTIGN